MISPINYSFNALFIAMPWLRQLVISLSPQVLRSIWGQSMWDLWWTKWKWDRFSSEYFHFPFSLLFDQCFIHIYSSTTDTI